MKNFSVQAPVESEVSLRRIEAAVLPGCSGIGDVYGPACGAGSGADGVERASAGGDEGGGDALVAQEADDAVDGEAFADAAGVEFHRLMVGEGDGAGLGVERDVVPADFVAQRVEFGLRRDAAVMEEEAPGAKERPDGDVECTVGDAAPVEGAVEEAEGFGVGDDGAEPASRLMRESSLEGR